MCISDFRSFQCALCLCQTQICKRCDRAHIYCPICAPLARRASTRQASKRYQQSRKGRFNHAKRQQRYRARQMNKVTHHSSPSLWRQSYLSSSSKTEVSKNVRLASHTSCHFCGATESLFLHNELLIDKGVKLNTLKMCLYISPS